MKKMTLPITTTLPSIGALTTEVAGSTDKYGITMVDIPSDNNVSHSPIPRFSKLLLTLTVIMLLSACASYPLGMSEAEWQSLSTEQQLQARQQQAERDKAADLRRSAEAAARQAEEARQSAEMEAKRSSAAYGERLQCVLQPAEAWLNRKWRSIEPQALDLVAGMELPLVLRQLDQSRVSYSSKAYARFNGQELTLCQHSESQSTTGRCVRILGTSADYHRGIRQNFQAEQFLRGHLRCDLVGPRRGYRG